MEKDFDTASLIERFKKFERESYDYYKDLYEQIKKDRQFIAGNQSDDLDLTHI